MEMGVVGKGVFGRGDMRGYEGWVSGRDEGEWR